MWNPTRRSFCRPSSFVSIGRSEPKPCDSRRQVSTRRSSDSFTEPNAAGLGRLRAIHVEADGASPGRAPAEAEQDRRTDECDREVLLGPRHTWGSLRERAGNAKTWFAFAARDCPPKSGAVGECHAQSAGSLAHSELASYRAGFQWSEKRPACVEHRAPPWPVRERHPGGRAPTGASGKPPRPPTRPAKAERRFCRPLRTPHPARASAPLGSIPCGHFRFDGHSNFA
jgi:hypothetical protein